MDGRPCARCTTGLARLLVAVVVSLCLLVTVGIPPVAAQQGGGDAAGLRIDGNGVGPLRVGQELTEFEELLPDGWALEADVVVANGAPELIVTVVRGTVEEIIVVGTSHRTRDGIGPGSLIRGAEVLYGRATVERTDDGREFARFDDPPAGLRFGTETLDGLAGIYEQEATTSLFYDPAAPITRVYIDGGAPDEPDVNESDSDSSPGQLADTGRTHGPIVLLATCAVSLGGGLVRAGQRRRLRY